MKKIFIEKIKDIIKEPTVVISTVVIGILACSDMYITWDIFMGNNVNPYEAFFYAFVLGIFLELAPVYLANFITILLNKTETRVSKIRRAKLVSIIMGIVVIVVISIVTYSRAEIIDSNGGLNLEGEYISGFEKFDYKNNDGKIIYNSRYTGYNKDLVLMMLPSLTSLFAFGISIALFKPTNIKNVKKEHKVLKDEIEKLEEEKNKRIQENLKIADFFDIRKININDSESKRELLDNKLKTSIDTCGEIFLYVYEAFEQGVEIYINTKLIEISKFSNIPNLICELDLKEVINSTDDIKEWNKDISEIKEVSLEKIERLVKDNIEIYRP